MIPQAVKCLFGFHAWRPWRYILGTAWRRDSRTCATCGKVQRRTR